ncbi:MAG: hypothetical protein H0T51_16250 [Pirellulales bacterium]|nr:hypothetical protein [Pirellulales bacterium]
MIAEQAVFAAGATADQIQARGPVDEPAEEGLTEDHRFVQQGVAPVLLTSREYDLMKFIWPLRMRRIPNINIEDEVWKKEIEEKTMPAQLYKLGNKLVDFGISFQVRQGFVTVDYPREYWD